MTDDELETTLGEALRPAAAQPPADRVAALRAHAERAGVGARRPPTRVLLAAAAGVALLVAGAAVGVAVTSGPRGSEQDLLARGTPEFAATLTGTARDGDGTGVDVTLDGSRAPEGRIVVLESETLPILPLGEYYELWFVGPDDSPTSPDRVSAGTFHPDYDDGGTLVVLHAAVDPSLFPAVQITAEVADGDPSPSADVVVEGSLRTG